MMSANGKYVNPDVRLAELMNAKLGTEVTPAQIKAFVLDNWRLVQAYSHSIHDHDVEDRRVSSFASLVEG